MDKILSFGGGLQTTALAILLAERKFQVDAVVFSDTGAEKPETYYYIEGFIKPLLSSVGVEFITTKHHSETLYEYCWRVQNVPSIKWRWCTDRWKVRPIQKLSKKAVQLIGFSLDEKHRADKQFERVKVERTFPLIEMGITAADCRDIISNYGWPRPLKSSCFFCCYQRLSDWQWLKTNHRDLFDQALKLEANMHKRKPHTRQGAGILQGRPLWRFAEGQQIYLPFDAEYSCFSGYCSH